MYRLIREKLSDKGIDVVEDTLKSSLGYCEVGMKPPVIFIEKNLDEMNKVSVLFHEAVHASHRWTKRLWWVYYRAGNDPQYMYMEEVLALRKQIAFSSFLGLEDSYSMQLAEKILKSYTSRLTDMNKFLVERESELVDRWLLNTFKGISDDVDGYFNETTDNSCPVRYRNISYAMDSISSR